jgi:hypothetical protein
MMWRKLGLVLVALAVPVAVGTPAEAANNACFDWSCDPSSHVCVFDASCSTITTGSLWRYRWGFGDGTGYYLTGSATITHTFAPPYPTVTLTLFLFGAPEVSKSCQITVFDNFGPPVGPYSGHCG